MTYLAGHTFDVAAVVYDADTHCVHCAIERFGASALAPSTAELFDSEGNPVTIIYAFQEAPDYVRVCGTCSEYIDEPERFYTDRLRDLEEQGFDKCSARADGVRVGCSQCEAIVIQGMATHETGCPNMVREEDSSDDEEYAE
jgi:hypothetical protein